METFIARVYSDVDVFTDSEQGKEHSIEELRRSLQLEHRSDCRLLGGCMAVHRHQSLGLI